MRISEEILVAAKSLLAGETNRVANMANLSALIMDATKWHWVGFYTVDKDKDELVLNAFQGPVACTRLRRGKGVCAHSWETNTTVVVDNVHDFPGHVACSSLSNSEVVIPVRNGGEVVAVLDIDSVEYSDFSSEEVSLLEGLVKILEERW